MTFSEAEGRERSHMPQLAMTPMIDVVFLLIVFFLTVKFAERAGQLETRLPKAEGIIPRLEQPQTPDSPEVWIRVEPGQMGTAVENGQIEPLLIVLNETRVKDLEELHYELVLLLARIKQAGDKPFVVLDLSSDLLYQSVVSTINVTKRAGIAQLNFTPPSAVLVQ